MAFLAAVSLISCTSREAAPHCEESYEEGHLAKIDYDVARCPVSDLARRWGLLWLRPVMRPHCISDFPCQIPDLQKLGEEADSCYFKLSICETAIDINIIPLLTFP